MKESWDVPCERRKKGWGVPGERPGERESRLRKLRGGRAARGALALVYLSAHCRLCQLGLQ